MSQEHKETNQDPAGENLVDDFFSSPGSRQDELKEFMEHMNRDKEDVEPPPFSIEPEEEEEVDETDPDALSEEEAEEMLNHFNYSEEHRYTAEFALVQLDKILAFAFSLFSGMDSDRYRKRKTKPTGEDYEAEILAALIHKYQMKMSLEWMFISALGIAYFPAAELAMKDKRELKKKEEVEREKARVKMYREAMTDGPGPA